MRIGGWCSIKITTVKDSVNAQDSKPLRVSTKTSKVCQLPVICQKHIASGTVRKPDKRISFVCFLFNILAMDHNSSFSVFSLCALLNLLAWFWQGSDERDSAFIKPPFSSNMASYTSQGFFPSLTIFTISLVLFSVRRKGFCVSLEFPWGTRSMPCSLPLKEYSSIMYFTGCPVQSHNLHSRLRKSSLFKCTQYFFSKT